MADDELREKFLATYFETEQPALEGVLKIAVEFYAILRQVESIAGSQHKSEFQKILEIKSLLKG